MNPLPSSESFRGALLGTAVGDALGLPMEGLSPRRIPRIFAGPLRMRFVFGHGMVSDDTEHSLMVAQALLENPDDSVAFQRALAWKLRSWFVGLPAGVGLATAKACLRMWAGFPIDKCAVSSGGSGPAMRSAIIGVRFANDPEKRRRFTLACSRLTHRGWQAETAALAVAEVASVGANRSPSNPRPCASGVLGALQNLSQEIEWQQCIAQIASSLQSNDSVADFAKAMGLINGVSGYALHVVPVALFVCLRHNFDFQKSLSEAISCGGDTDTVGAIVGALCGSRHGAKAIPEQWLHNLWEWPRSRAVMERIADRLFSQTLSSSAPGPIKYFWPAQLVRNLCFLAIVLAHGVRRLFPPY